MSPFDQQVVLIRHGETEWSRSLRHTSVTDVPLTDLGLRQAERLKPALAQWDFALVLSSPRRRALDTARGAGLERRLRIEPDLEEWRYGQYEGLTTAEIRRSAPGWTVFTHPCPGGETAEQVALRVDRVIAEVRKAEGAVALVAHAHLLRVLAVRWLGLDPRLGRHLLLRTGTLSVLGYERETPAILSWSCRVGD
jgi:probable phosphoglycerate mutase